jgi:DNA-binding NarL/FixJ family response regulator
MARGVWIDDRNPIYRRGMLACLQAGGYAIAGESAFLRPTPDLARTAVLVFDLDGVGVGPVVAMTRGSRVRLVGLVRAAPAHELAAARAEGISALVALRELTPARLLACVRAVASDQRVAPSRAVDAPPGGDLTDREFDVLRLLADGSTTRDIADRLSYSERTVKSIVHQVLVKLNGRTRAHAVALAARHGVI